MKKFLLKLALYSILPILYLGYGEWKLYVFGESVPVKHVIQKQLSSQHEFYFMRAFFGMPNTRYKMSMIKEIKPDVLVLGQSIVLQYRSIMFKHYEKSFYNAGLAIRNVYDVASFVKLLKSHAIHQPKLIVFGFDQSMIKQNYVYDINNNIEHPDDDPVLDPLKHLVVIQSVITARLYKAHTEPFVKTLGYGKFGGWGFGFRKDGSINNKERVEKFLLSRQYEDGYKTKRALHNRTNQYFGLLKVDPKKVALLLKSFHELKQMGIDLLIYCPPMSDDFFNYASKDAQFVVAFHQYIALQNQLIKQGYHVIPFCTPSRMGLNDTYMLDALHPGEVMVTQQLLSNLPEKFPYCSEQSLHDLLNRKGINPLSFMLDSAASNSNAYFK